MMKTMPGSPLRTMALWAMTVLTTSAGAAGVDDPAKPHERTSATQASNSKPVQVVLRADGATVLVTLDDNDTSKDFVRLLPLELTLEDYAGTEKISYLPRKLSTRKAPLGYLPHSGDVAYYAPWGNLALYYEGFDYSPGLIRLGQVQSGLERLRQPGPMKVLIEQVSE
jgi:hypothetical protein